MATTATTAQQSGILDKRALLQQVWQRPVRDVVATDTRYSAGSRKWIATAIAALSILAATNASADIRIRPLFLLAHTSDPLSSNRHEVTQDFIGGGIALELRAISIDAAIGRKATNCSAFKHCGSSAGAYLALRWTPELRR